MNNEYLYRKLEEEGETHRCRRGTDNFSWVNGLVRAHNSSIITRSLQRLVNPPFDGVG